MVPVLRGFFWSFRPVNQSSVELWMCLAKSNGNAQKCGTIFDQNLALLLGLDIVLAIE